MKCKIEECNSSHAAGGFCAKHYMQNKRATCLEYRKQEVERTKKWKLRNGKKHSAQQVRYRIKNRDKLLKYSKNWRKSNWKYYLSYLYARKKRLKRATPSWADIKAIQQFYLNCLEGYHVDHIIPLNGKNISGLHVLSNLQYLPAKENLSKGNKVA